MDCLFSLKDVADRRIEMPVFHINILGFFTAFQFLRHCHFAYFKILQKNMTTQSLVSYFDLDYFGLI